MSEFLLLCRKIRRRRICDAVGIKFAHTVQSGRTHPFQGVARVFCMGRPPLAAVLFVCGFLLGKRLFGDDLFFLGGAAANVLRGFFLLFYK